MFLKYSETLETVDSIFEMMGKSIFSSRQVTSIRSGVEGCSHNNTQNLPRTRHNEAGTPESNFAEQKMTGGVVFLLSCTGCILTGSKNIFKMC